MIINLLREPVERDLSDRVPGLKVTLNRLDSTHYALARDRAERAIASLREGLAGMADYGLDYQDADGRQLDPNNPDQMFRIGHLIASVELCILAIRKWEGPLASDGDPAKIDRKILTLLLLDQEIEARLLDEITKAARILIAEKKELPISPGGMPAGEKTGSARNTA